MLFWLYWWALLVTVDIGGQNVNGQVKKCSDECCPEINKKIIRECLKLGKIVHLPTFECFEVNSQGGCDEGEILVVMEKSECMATKCVKNKSADGKPCSEGDIECNGHCEPSGSKSACEGSGLGKRLIADLYGTVACRCAVDLGYVDVNGRCYHEYFKGPCQEGEQILRDGTKGWKCVKHSCNQGQVQWAKYGCFQLEDTIRTCEGMYDLGEGETLRLYEDQQLKDLVKVVCIEADVRSGSTFVNCAVRANDGTCLGKRRPPKVEITSQLLHNLFSQLNFTSHSDSEKQSILPRTDFSPCK